MDKRKTKVINMLAAVEQNGLALQFVEEQTPEITAESEMVKNKMCYAIIEKVKGYPEFIVESFRDPIEAREVAQGIWKGLSEDKKNNLEKFLVIKTTEKNIAEKNYHDGEVINNIKDSSLKNLFSEYREYMPKKREWVATQNRKMFEKELEVEL